MKSDWAILKCKNEECNKLFSVPSDMIDEKKENYRYMTCPYCNASITISESFIIHEEMNCGIKKIEDWVINS